MATKKTKRTTKKNLKKFIVSIAVECRVDKEVMAESFEDAFDKANSEGITNKEWKKAEVIDDHPVNAFDTTTGELKDY